MPITFSSAPSSVQKSPHRSAEKPANRPSKQVSSARAGDAVVLFGNASKKVASLKQALLDNAPAQDKYGQAIHINQEPALDRSAAKTTLENLGFQRQKQHWTSKHLKVTFNKTHLTIETPTTPSDTVKIPLTKSVPRLWRWF